MEESRNPFKFLEVSDPLWFPSIAITILAGCIIIAIGLYLPKKNHKIMYTELLKTDWGKWYNVQYRMVLKMYTLQCFLKELNVPYLFLNMLHPFQQSKINDMHNDHSLKSPPDFIGQSPIIKKTTKNNKPKLRFDDIFISDFDAIIYFAIPN